MLHLRSDIHLWSLPGGGVEPGEDWEEAAFREVREETGYEVALDRLAGEYVRPQIGDTKRLFVGHVIGGEPQVRPPESVGLAWFPDDIEPSSEVVAITGENLAVLLGHFPWTIDALEEVSPCRAIVVDGSAVSLSFSSRTSDDAAEAGVMTVEGFRGRGFAPLVVAAWANAVCRSGRIPLYSTSWENLASRAVAAKLGLVLYGSDLSIT